MAFATDRRGNVLLVRPTGDLDAHALPALEAAIAGGLAAGARHVVFDLAEVRLLPSTAIGVLIGTNRRVRAAGGRAVLAGVPPLVRGTLATMGVDALLRSYPDVDAAVESLA